MQPVQTFRLAAMILLLTAGVPLLAAPDFLLPTAAQAAPDRNAEGDRLLEQGIQQYQTSSTKRRCNPPKRHLNCTANSKTTMAKQMH